MYQYKNTAIATAIVIAIGIPFSSVSASENELRQDILNLKHKIERLEKSRKPVELSDKTKSSWFNNINLSGVVEVEAAYADTPDGTESDIAVSTVELGIDAQVTPWMNAHVLFLFEEGGSDSPEVDEAIITLGNLDLSPFSLAAGRMVVPFGNFESAMVSDPLTLEIGETRETALQAGYISGSFYGSVFAFNGDTNDGGSEAIDQFGLNLGLSKDAEGDGMSYDIGASWINNIADSNTLQEIVIDPDNLTDKVAGYGIHALASVGSFTFIGEYLSASTTFDTADLSFNGSGAKPAAFNVEVDYAFNLMGKEAEFGLAWQQTEQSLALELPEKRFLAALSIGIYHNTALSFEYAHDEDYAVSEGGSGEDSDTFTAQLAVEF